MVMKTTVKITNNITIEAIEVTGENKMSFGSSEVYVMNSIGMTVPKIK